MSRKRDGREIIKRIIVRGVLVLDTPTCLSNGDAEGVIDMMLLRDSISPKALLTGSSIAGALRNYLHEYEKDYCKSAIRQDMATKLFGDLFAYQDEKHLPEKQKLDKKQQDTQSPLIIDDALSSTIPQVELRDGVKINGATGTADDGAKYDLEFLVAGTQFPLNFELLIEKDKDENQLREALAIALEGLKAGEISIGMKKQRGFGRCHVGEWQVWELDLRQHSDRLAWLTFDRSWNQPYTKSPSDRLLSNKKLKQLKIDKPDKRDRLFIHAKFKLASPLLIRSGQDLTKRSATDKNSKLCVPDVVHLRSQRSGKLKPVVSGTSLAGVLWHRAERIVNTLGKDLKIVYDLFGKVDEKTKEAKASRLIIHESEIESTDDLVQNRIAIDRFTGGTYHGALFSEQPIFGIEQKEGDRNLKKGKGKSKPRETAKHFELNLELRQPKKYEIGLLLLLLKDLWTGDLPVGGTVSIGRGRLKGVEATIVWQDPKTSEHKWTISEENDKLTVSDKDREILEDFVHKFVEAAP